MVAIESTQANILAIEDEEAIREMLTLSLEREGHTVVGVSNVAAAKRALDESSIDIAIVDWMLPGGSGIEFVRLLRKSDATRDLPVIMLTARTDEDDITAGLDAGADDYVTKPFSPRELNSRIKALLRRSKTMRQSDTSLAVGPITLDTETHRVGINHQPLELGHTEFKLLRFFMANPERVYSRSQLLDQVWGVDTFIEERTVDVHILRLRKNLDPLGAAKMLETVRGAGYRLTSKTP
jgi:two-component system phosphate regulon response regulator PhoB